MLHRHRADDSVAKAIGQLIRADLIIIDDVALLRSHGRGRGAIPRRRRRLRERSIALTSRIHPAGFDKLMPKTIATATVDGFHHAHVLVTDGSDSYRLSKASTGKGVTPWPDGPRRGHRHSAPRSARLRGAGRTPM